MPPAQSRVVTVEIQGQRYPVRSDLDAAYVADLATYVDSKMRLASRETSAADSMRIAVIAALNIADELFRAREEVSGENTALLDRAAQLERILDSVLSSATDADETRDRARARVV
jgi:cell division protein ZapA